MMPARPAKARTARRTVSLRARRIAALASANCVVGPAAQVLVEDQPDADAAVGQVGHGAPALVDLHRPVLSRHAPAQVLTQGHGGVSR